MSPRKAPEPEPDLWPPGHAWTTTVSLRLIWTDGRWQVAADPALVRDPNGCVCNYGLHLTASPDVRNRCRAIAANLDAEPMPSPMQLARQLAALAGLILAPMPEEDTPHAEA